MLDDSPRPGRNRKVGTECSARGAPSWELVAGAGTILRPDSSLACPAESEDMYQVVPLTIGHQQVRRLSRKLPLNDMMEGTLPVYMSVFSASLLFEYEGWPFVGLATVAAMQCV